MRRDSHVVLRSIKGCRAGMAIVRRYQIEGVSKVILKDDQTLRTIADTASQEAVKKSLRTSGGESLTLWGEEDGVKTFLGYGRYGVLIDPLDGTNAFVTGLMTSTVIVGVYDRGGEALVACVIGEPVSGRLWVATDEDDTWACHTDRACTTWRQGMLAAGNVFLDVSHGFKTWKTNLQCLSDEESRALYGRLASRAKVMMPWSNGLMQAMVANGNEGVAGSITTAVGFPGDVCGALLVKQAHGAVAAFTRTPGGWQKADPLNVLEVDMLVCAASEVILQQLLEIAQIC